MKSRSPLEQGRNAPLQHLAAHRLLVDEFAPHDAVEMRAQGDEIDRVLNPALDTLAMAFGSAPDRAGRRFEPGEDPIEHRQVKFVLGGEVMEQRGRLDSDSGRDVAQARAAIAALREQRLRDLQHAVARVGPAMRFAEPRAGACRQRGWSLVMLARKPAAEALSYRFLIT